MHRLRKKGWSEKELTRLHRAKLKAEKHKSAGVRFLDRYLFWLIIFAGLISNFLLAIIFLPFMLVLKNTGLFFVVIALGLSFGFLFENLLSDFEELSHHHYVLIVGIVPAIAAISVMVFSEFANFLIRFFELANVMHPSMVIGIVYGLSFLAPFSLKHIFRKH